MTCTFKRLLTGVSFAEADARTRNAPGETGFGVLTVTDVAATMKKKLDVEMTPHLILGACNPGMAYQAIGIEPRVGAMLHSNVILWAVDGRVEVSVIDPVASMQAIDNPAIHAVVEQVRDLLAKAVAAI